ncbi:MerR family transcriptional regulator [Enterococcus mundtii]|uniref:MerR family transcriptional regulator n=1 Tax=Enterococcus mundtii TaxID=53346 RepID=UPI003970F1D1
MRETDIRSELLTIGELAKITGVNIKSIRYYEQIGVLLPVYINPSSGYRYYSLAQVSAVELIQACVEIGIPLKELHRFSDPKSSIDYLSFLSYSEELMKQKIDSLQQNLKGMQEVKEEIKLLKKYRHSKKQHIRQLSEKYLYVFPYQPTDNQKTLYTEAANLFDRSIEDGYEPLYDFGFLYEFAAGNIRQYMYIEIRPTSNKSTNIKKLPGGNYACRFNSKSYGKDLPELFPEIFEEKINVLAVEAEAATGTLEEIVYEARVFIDQKDK